MIFVLPSSSCAVRTHPRIQNETVVEIRVTNMVDSIILCEEMLLTVYLMGKINGK